MHEPFSEEELDEALRSLHKNDELAVASARIALHEWVDVADGPVLAIMMKALHEVGRSLQQLLQDRSKDN